MTRPSLEQAVAHALAKIPHDADCPTQYRDTEPGGCDAVLCDREQRIAARVAAAIEWALAEPETDKESLTGAYLRGVYAKRRDNAVRALTEERPA